MNYFLSWYHHTMVAVCNVQLSYLNWYIRRCDQKIAELEGKLK